MSPQPDGWLETLAGLPADVDAQRAFFQANPALNHAATVNALHEEVLRALYADLDRAHRLAHAAYTLGQCLAEPAARAAGLRAMGHVSYAGSNYQQALDYYSEAIPILSALGHDHELGRTLSSGLQPLIYLGRYSEAYEWAARATAIFERLGDPLRLARLASNIGNILYRQDRYAEALESYRKAYATLGTRGEGRDVAAVLSNMAVCNISLSRFPEALQLYTEAREYCQRHDLSELVAGADYNIAYLHYLQGDFLRAIELYKRSREHYGDGGDRYHAALCDLDESEIELELNLNAEAAQLAARAEQGFAALAMPYERGKALVTQAIAASRRGRPQAAAGFFAQAREIFAAEGNPLWPALIDLYRATLLEREGSAREAARLARRAVRVLSGSMMPGRAALAQLLLARLLLRSQRVREARRICDLACRNLESAGTPWLRFHAHFVRGQVEERSGNPGAAFACYQAAREEIENMRSRLWGDEVKITFLKDKLAVYESLVALRLGSRQPAATAEAFEFIQQAKSRGLADLISRAALSASTATPDRALHEARLELNTHYRRMEHLALGAHAASPAQVEALRHAIRECEGRLARMVADATPSPGFADPLTLQAIQAAIPDGAMLLEYYVAKGILYVCLLDGKRLEIVPLTAAEEVRTSLRLLRFQLARFRTAAGPAPAGEDATHNHLRTLYDELIAPLRSRLHGFRHLILAPHDFLHHLPFHALASPDGYLIDRFTVSYAPSATVFALCSRRPPASGGDSLVFGLPDERAPHIRVEAETAARLLPDAQLFLGEQATDAVLRRLGPTARVIHIAAHGLFRRDNPLFSAIRLGNGHFTLLDLYGLPLTADLVSLSGCSTGLNVVVGGDELLGLMRGLLLAGARGVMVSLWDVDDATSARYMNAFYQHLSDGGDKAAAIRSAMLHVRSRDPHPYHWAPFVLAGSLQ